MATNTELVTVIQRLRPSFETALARLLRRRAPNSSPVHRTACAAFAHATR
jgi:hypothetical protein